MDRVQSMLEWLKANGGHVHQSSVLQDDPIMGISLFASADIPANETLIACPADLIITPESSTDAICKLLNINPEDLIWPAGSSSTGKTWNERMRICVYLCLHWIHIQNRNILPDDLPSVLRHWPYISSLPVEHILTPLRFTRDEMELLHGTNLHGATADRTKEWRDELDAIKSIAGLGDLTWDRYLTAATYLSSRAFPSSLLHAGSREQNPTPTTSGSTVENAKEAHPVLIPGLDLLNHYAEAPVLWRAASSSQSSSSKTVSIESPAPISEGSQIWNNYGPRSNEELLLGYGFVIPDNPHDTVVLKLGSSSITPAKQARLDAAKLDAGKRYHLRRDGAIDRGLLQVLRILLSGDNHTATAHHHEHADVDDEDEDEHAQMEKEQRELELELDVLGMLGGMLDDKLAKLDLEPPVAEARPAVREMCRIYRQGQKEIIATTLDKLSERIEGLERMLDSGMTCSCCM